MKQICGLCKSDLNKKQASGPCITGGICSECAQKFRLASGAEILKEIIETIDAPILLMQAEPRQVYTANSKALGLFNKELAQIAGHRGGQVLDCIHAFTEAGCGKDVNCDNCKIKNAVIDTFMTGTSHEDVSTDLQIKKNGEISFYQVQVATEKAGDLELLRIDHYRKIT